MRLLSGSIAGLTVSLLFLQAGMWLNSEVRALTIALLDDSHRSGEEFPLFNDSSMCSETISRKVSQYVPYLETFRAREWGLFYRIISRINYKIQFHTEWVTKTKCCKGYRQLGATCKPHCEQSCAKGTCVQPNVCVCNTGYRMSNDTNGKESCLPVCTNDCINGTCIEPDICTCDENYWMDSDGFTCRPVCDEDCERNHGFCSEPRVCSCRPGYKKTVNELHVSNNALTCEPVCDRACTNGRCAAPNVCKCDDGYTVDEFNPRFFCKPRCSEVCIFGACTAPEVCSCDEGYRAVNASVCEPICTEPCKMGVCVAPESCSCHDGYGLLADSKYVCEPICEADCANASRGTCVAPETCTCDEGFFYDRTERTCKPRCEIPCGPNEECVSPNNCVCLEGYRAILLNESDKTILRSAKEPRPVCQPVCDFKCTNGECIAPNVCSCAIGYRPTWTEQSLSLNNSAERACEPVCNVVPCGSNGMCVAPDVCTCDVGYTKHVDGRCLALCARACINGTCTAPNRCTCDDGFALRNASVCEAICTNGCRNGDCVAPNRCVCRNGYVLNTESRLATECVPACFRNCSGHGACVVSNDGSSCDCDFGWAGSDCDQPTVCAITMDLDRDDASRIVIRNDTNSTVSRAYGSAPYCYQCREFLSNETLCYIVKPEEINNVTFTVGCLFSTEMPCYSASSDVAKIVWSVAIAFVLIDSATIAVFLIYRRRQKKKLIAGDSTANLVRDSCGTESLSCENATYL